MTRYGSREIMDVVLKNPATGEPVVYLESLTTSTLEFQGSTVYARGGKGHPKLIGWDSEKDVTLNMEDALISKESLGVLTGSEFKKGVKPVHKKEVITVEEVDTLTLEKEPLSTKPAFFYRTVDGTSIGEKLVSATPVTQEITLTGLSVGDKVIADYYYAAPDKTQSMTIASDVFPGTYLLEGTTMWRNEDGKDVEALYTVPKLKVLPGFSIGMASTGDPQPFTFTCEVLKDTKSTAMVIIDLLED